MAGNEVRGGAEGWLVADAALENLETGWKFGFAKTFRRRGEPPLSPGVDVAALTAMDNKLHT